MGFPGDHHESGGWGAPPPPQSGYGPAERQTHDTSYDRGSPYDRGTPHGDQGPSYENSPYGQGAGGQGPSYESSPYDQGPRHGGQGPSYENSPYDQGPPHGGQGPSYGNSPYGQGPSHEGSPYDEGPPHGGQGLSYESSLYDQEPGAGQYGRPPRSGGKRWVIGAAVAAGVVILGGGAGLFLTSGGDPSGKPTTPPAATSPTVNPTPTPTETGKGQRLLTRATDPEPLTLNEVFKHRKFKGGGRVYTMTVRRANRVCARGTHGTAFRKLLVRGGCNQVLRATFTNGKLIGTIGILNLRTQNGARVVQRSSRPKDTFVMPLPGSGTTSKIGQGLSLTTAEANGHYVIMSWIQYPNGKKIAQSDYSAVTAFVQYTTLGSNLRPALNYRSMVGKPA
jgi:hypothetical protein